MVLTLTAMTLSHSSSVTSRIEPLLEIPTLLTRMSSLPYRSTAAATIRRQSDSIVTSALKTEASPPSPRIRARVSSARSSCMSASTTLAPSLAKSTAAAFPLPMPAPLDPAPVTMATLPSNLGRLSGIYPSLRTKSPFH